MARVEFSASTEHQGQRLDRFLQTHLGQYSRTRLQGWIKAGRVLVNGAEKRASYSLREGDLVSVAPAERAPLRAVPERIPLKLLYEDDDVIAVDKPAGMVVHAGAGVDSGTLVNALLDRFQSLSRIGGDLRPGIVHRLDRYTSGVLLIAKTDAAHQNLAKQFASRQVVKTYLALVHGIVKRDQGQIEKLITRDPIRRVRMTARLMSGRAALTQYRVLRRFSKFTFLEVRIATGRTHQIRVHFSSLGHPVVGDRLYGAPARIEGQPDLGRYFLHAYQIHFRRPSTGEAMQIESPLPPELERWMNGLL